MGLLDGGIQGLFGTVFGGLYLSGTLHSAELSDDGQGGMTESLEHVPIRYQRDDLNVYQRTQLKIPDNAVTVLILQHGVARTPKTQDKFTIEDGTFVVVDVQRDPADAYWQVSGTPAPAEEGS